MKLKDHKPIIIRGIIILSVIILCLIYWHFRPVKEVVNIIICAFIVAYAMRPIRNTITEKMRISDKKASLLIILITLLFFCGMIYFIVPTIISESANFGSVLDNLEGYINSIVTKFNISDTSFLQIAYAQINEKINVSLSSFNTHFVDNMISIMENLVGIAIVPVVAYYFLADGDLLYNKLLLIFPTEKRVIIKKINNNIDKVLSRYIISQLVLSGIIGVLTLVLMLGLRLKFALVLSILNAFVNIIPYFGPIIGGIPIVLIALIESPSKAILALIGAALIQQIEGDLLAPKITGDSTNLHPIIIIILLILGEKMGGLVGMVLAVPVVVMIKVIYDDINYYLF